MMNEKLKLPTRSIYLGSGEFTERVWSAWTTYVGEQGFTTNAQCLDWLLQHVQLPSVSYCDATTQCDATTLCDTAISTADAKKTLLQSVESRLREAQQYSTSRGMISTPIRHALVSHLQRGRLHLTQSTSLSSSFMVETSVDPITEESAFEADIGSEQDAMPLPLHVSTPKSRKRAMREWDVSEPQPSENENISVHISQEGNLEVTLTDVTCDEMDQGVGPDEETFIQEVVDRLDAPHASSSTEPDMIDADVYQHIRYGDLQDELKLINEAKCFAYVWSLVQLLGEKCRESSCSALIENSHVIGCGFCVKIEWCCTDGHQGSWYSSPMYASGFGINYLVNTAVLVSGGTVTQFHRFCDFLGLCHESQDSFYRNQRFYAAPAINQVYEERQRELVRSPEFQGRKLVICGDARMDSPGFSATKATYSFMEHDSSLVLHMEHGDKRQVNLKSTNMEAHLFKKGLVAVRSMVLVDEVCTDANVQIISILKKFPDFKDIFHSLDVWHKASKISKKLAEAASKKSCHDLQQWIPAIRNHFWWVCARVAQLNSDDHNSDAARDKIRELWVSVVHHVCGNHEWAGGRCQHDAKLDAQNPEGKKYLNPESPAAEALRNIVFDTRWLRSLDYYIRSRHTGQLEVFHSLMTTYAPKRIGYKHDGYTARMQLACLDQNAHCKRPQLRRKDGTLVFSRKWSKRCGQWSAVPVYSKKDYAYIPDLMACILYRRHVDRRQLLRGSGVKSKIAKTLAPNIASVPAPPTSELVKTHISRKHMYQGEI